MGGVWWVNQRREAYATETGQGMIWAPLVDRRGRRLTHWERMDQIAPGDVVLHYHDGAVVAVSVARTGATRAEHPSGDARWTREGRMVLLETWELDVPVRREALPLEVRVRFSGPAGPFTSAGRVQQGYLFAVAPMLACEVARLGGFLADLDLRAGHGVDSGAGTVASSQGTKAGLSERGFGGSDVPPVIGATADGQRVVVWRPEQRQLASFLFGGRPVGTCAFCGREFPRRFLVTAHLKPRAKASLTERADHAIVVAACSLGCDALFENGAIVVDGDGVVRPGVAGMTEDLEAVVEGLSGRRVSPYGPGNAKYFDWHRRSFGVAHTV